jgi:hypothetical protein
MYQVPLGHVTAVWRYPVKSLQGDRCAEVAVDRRGLVGDRVYALRTASGKSARRLEQVDGLLGFQARHGADGLPVKRRSAFTPR